jgi:hypothetical protein
MAWKLINQDGMETDITLYEVESGTTTGGDNGAGTDKKGGFPSWLSIVIIAVVGVVIIGLFLRWWRKGH